MAKHYGLVLVLFVQGIYRCCALSFWKMLRVSSLLMNCSYLVIYKWHKGGPTGRKVYSMGVPVELVICYKLINGQMSKLAVYDCK